MKSIPVLRKTSMLCERVLVLKSLEYTKANKEMFTTIPPHLPFSLLSFVLGTLNYAAEQEQ